MEKKTGKEKGKRVKKFSARVSLERRRKICE
jgi:hypothetical protein